MLAPHRLPRITRTNDVRSIRIHSGFGVTVSSRRAQWHKPTTLEHDPEKWVPVFGKIMLKQNDERKD
jgi:hypothetical protein